MRQIAVPYWWDTMGRYYCGVLVLDNIITKKGKKKKKTKEETSSIGSSDMR